MSQGLTEKFAMGVSAAVIVGWGIFWIMQVQDVMELLSLAYG